MGAKTEAGAVFAIAMMLLGSGFYLGRASAPKSVHDTKIATVETKSITAKSSDMAQDKTVDAGPVIQYVERVVRLPSGKTIDTKTSTITGAIKSETKSEAKATETVTATSKSDERVEHIAAAPQPRFSIGVSVASGLDFKPRYEAEVGVRVIGPAWVTLGADIKSRALMAGVALVF